MSTLHAFFEAIQANTAIDFDSPEVKDITTAVEELLHRYTRKLNESNDLFQIDHIQPCGSMVEKTAVWRSVRLVENSADTDEKYFEFDFLAVLENSEEFLLKEVCPGCREVEYRDETTSKTNLWKSDEMETKFHYELHKSIAAICNCFTSKYSIVESSKVKTCSFQPFLDQSANGCMKCTVSRETGILHIATGIDTSHVYSVGGVKCSFVLTWTSTSNSLVAPSTKTLQKIQVLKDIRIYIDLLPSFKINQCDTNIQMDFVVAKSCCSCRAKDSWRISNCLMEKDEMMLKVSTHHRNCYTILKYLNEIYRFSESGYHMKTMFLRHCMRCKETEKYAICIENVLDALEGTYVGSSMETFGNNVRFRLVDAGQFRRVEIIQANLQTIRDYLKFADDCSATQFSIEKCVSIMRNFVPSLSIPIFNSKGNLRTPEEFCRKLHKYRLRDFQLWFDSQKDEVQNSR